MFLWTNLITVLSSSVPSPTHVRQPLRQVLEVTAVNLRISAIFTAHDGLDSTYR